MSSGLIYVYCLLHSVRRPALRHVPDGMPGGGNVRAISVGDELWAVVSNVPEPEYGEAGLARGLQDVDWVGERAVAHERVVERFLGAAAVLPMQLFTIFTSDDRVINHVRADRRRINRILRRIEGKVEWGLRLTWNEKAARARAGRKTAHRGAAVPRGTAYLARKRDMLDLNRAGLAQARAEADTLYKAMSREAAEATRRTSLERAAPGSRLLLDAAFLVRSRDAGAFRAELRTRARSLKDTGVSVSLTGPWPPYNFIGR